MNHQFESKLSTRPTKVPIIKIGSFQDKCCFCVFSAAKNNHSKLSVIKTSILKRDYYGAGTVEIKKK